MPLCSYYHREQYEKIHIATDIHIYDNNFLSKRILEQNIKRNQRMKAVQQQKNRYVT